jgi:hypothetical protein
LSVVARHSRPAGGGVCLRQGFPPIFGRFEDDSESSFSLVLLGFLESASQIINIGPGRYTFPSPASLVPHSVAIRGDEEPKVEMRVDGSWVECVSPEGATIPLLAESKEGGVKVVKFIHTPFSPM